MKVEWKKFDGEAPICSSIWFLKNGKVEFFSGNNHYSLKGVTHWAEAEMPEPPEEEVKVRLKPGVSFKRNDFIGDVKIGGGHGWYATGSNGRLHYLSPDIFEEVTE